MSVNVEKINLEIAQLEYQSKELEKQIWKLEEEQDVIRKQIVERKQVIERSQYHGMLQSEYFKSIEGMEFAEGEYTVKVGSPYSHSVMVTGMDGDMQLTVTGTCTSTGAVSLKLNRSANHAKGTRWYDKTYYTGEIPKARQKQYDEMVALKDKYGKMMIDAEIKPVEAM